MEDFQDFSEEDELMIFVGDLNNRELSDAVGQQLGIAVIYPDKHVFDDGELRIRIETPVLDEEVFVLKSTCPPVNENYLELLFTTDALKRSGAKKVTAIIPYLGYSRADHVFREGEAVPLEVVIKSLEATGLDKVILTDPHTIKLSEMFQIESLMDSALPIFADKIKTFGFENSEISIVSPDMGGIRRVKMLSELLPQSTYAAINKDRDLASGELTGSRLAEGEIRRICIVTDDIISTGGTIVRGVDTCFENGAETVYVFATQPVFSSDAHEKLKNSKAQKIYVTDAIEVPEGKKFENLEIISLAPHIAKLLA